MPDRNARVWTGSAWELISAPVSTANAVAVWQSTAPSSPVTGQIWIDSDDNKMYVWSGSAWIAVALDLSAYATLASPIFTGTVVLPTNTSIGNVSSTEIGYLDGVTSAIQTQLNDKVGSSSPSFSGIVTIPSTTEILSTGTISSNIFTANFNNGGVFYITSSPVANFTINVTNLPTTENRVTVLSFFVIQGATGYIPNTFQISGSAQTIKWSNGVAPVPTSSSGKVDVFTFTVIRRSSSWEVLGTSDKNY